MKNCSCSEPGEHGTYEGFYSAATCTKPPQYANICNECGGKVGDTWSVGEALGHTEENPTVVDPTCTSEGSKIYTCGLCNETITETIAKLDHDWDSGTVISEANCVHGNITKYTCQRKGCTETYEEDDGSDAGTSNHDWDDGTVIKNSTCTEEGQIKYICKRDGCGASTTFPIEKLEHNYKDVEWNNTLRQ